MNTFEIVTLFEYHQHALKKIITPFLHVIDAVATPVSTQYTVQSHRQTRAVCPVADVASTSESASDGDGYGPSTSLELSEDRRRPWPASGEGREDRRR